MIDLEALRARSACRDMRTELFYAEGDPPAAAVAACERCPADVRSTCLQHALEHEAFGYWGGTTAADRRAIRRRLDLTLHRPESIMYRAGGMS